MVKQSFGSWTALFVARPLIQYWIYGDPVRRILDRVVPAPAADLTRRLLYEACPRAALLDRLLTWLGGVTVAVVALAQKLWPDLPALDVSICLRKRYFHDRVRAGIEAGARHVLVLGAGYDVLVAGLAPLCPDVLFVEVDHPSTAVFKQAALRKIGCRSPNARYVAVDLGADALDERLLDECRDWDVDAKSVVVAEGLLMYLAPDAVLRLLRSVKAVSGPGSEFAFTYLVQSDLDRTLVVASAWFRTLLRWAGEPILWAPPFVKDVGEMLAADGFQVDLSPRQSDHYQLYLAEYGGQIPAHPYYQNKHGVAIVE